ncbi:MULTISPECIES: ABC transporter ATP-binding protein [Okeania]|uniref:ABC transporter ATP-binding protein n=2 Tax=Okeania TaxID=1458928 RepID=A0A3N6P2D2_9CYAN|nr:MULTISPECIES: ABC transporter ATP-binding protein [Okeania]NES76714.1 ABC transporter ATP-binding protein [Okeania sp. SIO1H4]NET22912.1 ABC transporter ATP-binding protein [Okeania sp. SIO1H5]NET76217.1 ABC transporter ATP-binding protein [Okeania sp. SIO1F9]NET96277.1 ABC transporter ATP-binding protein [Okeania sp. SIO1H2]RQH13796.1 ABC transporter ATP-binding protein [Okeania hirsuta]
MSTKEFILRFIRRYPFHIIGNIALGFAGGLFNGVNTALIVPILLQISGQEIELKGSPPIINFLLSPFEGVPEKYRLVVMLLAVILTIVLKNLTIYLKSLLSVAFSRRLTNSIKSEMFQTLMDSDLDFFTKVKVGDLTKRLGSDTAQCTATVNAYINLITQLITVLLFVSILISISWQLTLISTLLVTLIAGINQLFILRSKKFGSLLNRAQKTYAIKVIEALSGIRLIKSVSSENREYKQLRKLMLSLENIALKEKMNSALIAPVNEVTSIITVICILLLGKNLFAGTMENVSAILLTYLLVLFRLLPMISGINSTRNQIAKGSASFDMAVDLWRRDNKPIMKPGSIPFQKVRRKIHFNKISFSYPGNSNLVLKNVDVSVPQGKTLALVGGSGAGKSTFADLLPRFYDPTSGSITIDGIDLREFDITSLRKRTGIVSQTTHLFNDTVRNNIFYACPDATEDEIIQAAKQANAYDFIMELPKQWDTEIGDRGVMLSGGQRQRLAIARALLQDPEILILDEATSALDTVSERLVQEAIDQLSRDRTVLVIAHRLSTIQNADKIAVLERGELVEIGTHLELLQKEDGYYRRLYSIQFGGQSKADNYIDQQLLTKASYEARGFLNQIVGSLRLLVDEIIDTPEEQTEITEEAFQSAISLLRTLEIFENQMVNGNKG